MSLGVGSARRKFFIGFMLVLFLSFIVIAYPVVSEVSEDVSQNGNPLPDITAYGYSTRVEWIESENSWDNIINEMSGKEPVRILTHIVRFKMPTVKKASSDSDKYDRVAMEDTDRWYGQTGAPLLPVRPLRILIPYQYRVKKIKVYKGPQTGIEGEFLIEPVQEPIPSSIQTARVTLPDAAIYNSANPYPSVPCGDSFIQKQRGYTILILNFFPVKYHPLEKKISYYPEVKVQIETVYQGEGIEDAAASHEIPLGVDSSYADEIRTLVDNPEVLGSYPEDPVYRPQEGLLNGKPGLPQIGYEYVIITNNNLRDASTEYTFQDLISQKGARGLTATIVTVEEDIYPYYSGTETGDNADKIRHFIADAYVNWGTRWVLLGGDIEVIPKRGVYISSGSYILTDMPSDLYYACLDGPWNRDMDELWGEYNDGDQAGEIDFSAEVYIGRAPVSNAQELSNFVAKTIQYETQAHPNNKTAILLGEQLDSITYGSYSCIPIKEQCLPSEWTVIERYDSLGGWNGVTFIGDLNNSPHIIEHLGHSNETYNARIWDSDVANLTNEHPYIMYSQGCNAGSFDTHDISIAEQHLVSLHGAVAVVMNARYGWYAPGSTPAYSHHYASEFWDAPFNEGKVHLGEINQDSRDDNLFRVGSTGAYRWIHFEVNLLGDPETSFDPSASPPPDVVCDFTGTPTSGCAPMTVSFTDQSTGPVIIWSWDFGDGSYSSQQNPSHVYEQAGTYTVSLTVASELSSDTETKMDYITVGPLPEAEFSATSQSGCAPLTVDFNNLSTGDPTFFEWDFGDGTTHSFEQHPSHIYDNPGDYTVTLTVMNNCGSDIETKVDYIHVDLICATKDYAEQDIPVTGTLSGTYTNTLSSDNIHESITEVQSGGKPSNRNSLLEHKWMINVTGGEELTFYIEAYQSVSTDNDEFVFEYSINDDTYSYLLTVNTTTETQFSAEMPNTLSGVIYLRVKDTNRDKGNLGLDTIYIDEMYIESIGTPPEPGVMHVDLIQVNKTTIRNKTTGTAQVWVVDSSGTPVPDATVYGTWTGLDSTSGVTDGSGRAIIESKSVKDESYCFEFCVDDIQKPQWQYNPIANHQTCNSDASCP